MKILTNLLIFVFLISQPFAIFAETITPVPTQEISPSITPTPTEEPAPPIEPSPTLTVSPKPIDTTYESTFATSEAEMIQTESTDILPEESMTPSMTPTITPAASPSPQEATESAQINTGQASTTVQIDNTVNTNITGKNNCMLILSHNFNTQDILDLTEDCQNVIVTSEINQNINNQNASEIQTAIQAIADTGKNVLLVPEGTIDTGDSSVQVDLFNLINTNISGDNTLFGVINLFNPQKGDILLPYELDYLLKGQESIQPIHLTQTTNSNANVKTDIDVKVNTGDNSGAEEIETGNAESIIKLYDKVNTSIVGSNFLILEINNFGSWDGKLIGWWGNMITHDSKTFAYYNGYNLSEPNNLNIQNNATATVRNSIQVIANTGENIASDGAKITTGDAQAKVNVFDFVNTNITGNNWYHVVINIFDTFQGNIIFPRPDLSIQTTADKSVAETGQTVTFRTDFFNHGTLFSRDTFLETELPENLAFTEASNGGVFSNGFIRWNLGKLLANDIGSVWFRTKALQPSNSLEVKTIISTSTDEPKKQNNSSILTLVISLIQRPSDTSTQSIPDEYIIEEPILPNTNRKSSFSRETYQYESSVQIQKQSPATKRNILGEQSHQPIARAQSVTPSIFFLMYLIGSAVVVIKEWLE